MKKKIQIMAFLFVVILLTSCGSKEQKESFEEKQAAAEAKIQAEKKEQEEKRLQAQKEEEEKKAAEERKAEEEAERKKAEEEKMPKNPLTGLPMDSALKNQRPVGIMISNIEYALPQSGIEAADIIYEALAEGGITRLFAVFQDFKQEKIGPIRSCRHYFLDFALDHDSLYVHAGQSPQGEKAIKDLKIANLNSISYLSGISFYLDPNRKAPHSTYTNYEKLLKGWENKKYRKEINPDTGTKFSFATEEVKLEQGRSCYYLKLPYSYIDSPYFQYDEEKKEYLRFQFGKPHLDIETGNQLHVRNIVLQLVDIWNIPKDDAGRIDMKLIGEGKGYYFTGGKYIPISWKKESHGKTTKYFDANGKEIVLNPGKTWIGVYPQKRENLLEMKEKAQ